MKRISLFILAAMALHLNGLEAQTPITLDSCYALARQNYPLVRQLDLIESCVRYTIENASMGYYPQLSINGQATYQSDVTQVPVSLPNVPVISKDQYKLYADLNQTVYDGGTVKLQKEMISTTAEMEKQNIEVELYKLRERINQVFFGTLMLDEQLLQAAILNRDLQAAHDRTKASVANGVSLKSSADLLQAEILKLKQRITELQYARAAYIDMLSLFMGRQLGVDTKLEIPQTITVTAAVHRPELMYYDSRSKMLDLQQRQISARSMPRLGLFVQAGYGRPALNMLNNEFDLYYIGGIRFSWSLTSLYTAKNEKAVLGVNYRLLESQRETFLFNTEIVTRQNSAEVLKLEELVRSDNEIILLRESIRKTAQAQLENGIITASDYLRELNAEDQARQNRSLHQIQLLMTLYRQQFNSGN
jgi:outer membrane protein TolC